jgi:hypothetical protein
MIGKIENLQSDRPSDEREGQDEDVPSTRSFSSPHRPFDTSEEDLAITSVRGIQLNRECGLAICRETICILLLHIGFEGKSWDLY